jgi:hypothetical protein
MSAFCKTALTAAITFALAAGFTSHAVAQQHTRSVKQQLVGTWVIVSNANTTPDGKPYEAFGGNTKGILMFDRAGHFSEVLMGDARRKFASNNRLQGTPDENKAAVAGELAIFGTYDVDATGNTLTMHVEDCSFPNWDGTDLKRTITLARDELKWSNLAASAGGTANLVWRRVK